MPTNNYTFKKLAGSAFTQPDNVVSSTPLELDKTLLVTIIVRRPATEISITDYAQGVIEGKYPTLSQQEFKDKYGTAAEDFAVVREFVESFGITVVGQYRSSGNLNIQGTVDQINQAFGVTLLTVETAEETHISYLGEVSIPESLDGIVEYVLGLDTSWKLRSAAVVETPSLDAATDQLSSSVVTFLTPARAAAAYQMPVNTGAGQTIGLLEFGGGFTQQNIDSTFSRYGLTPPTVIGVPVNGGTNNPNDPSGASVEVMLDIACAGGVAPGAKIVTYFAPNSFSNFLNAFNAAINDNVNNPSVISLSWIGVESTFNLLSLISSIDSVLQTAVVKGITIFASCGDWGPKGQPNSPAYTVGYPSSSPYVVSCGGTTLEIDGANSIISEVVWSTPRLLNGSATGGGISAFEPMPSYQAGKGLKTTVYPGGSAVALSMRGVPDWGGNANPSSGYQFFYGSANTLVQAGGTSATAPHFAGCIARMNYVLSPARIGFVNALSYNNPGAFRDITVGQNNTATSGTWNIGYSATTGWDAVTGLGSPIGTSLMAALSNADLSSLAISSGVLTPAFSSSVVSYTNTVNSNQDSVSISASASQLGSSLKLNGIPWNGSASIINLNPGSNANIITVTAPDTTTTKSYSVDIVRIIGTETYSIIPSTPVISEGGTIVYNILTTNVADGTTLYWTNNGTTVAVDFADNTNSGSITINSGNATVTRTLLNDVLTEGTETILIQLRSGSVAGGILATADPVAVIDSSTRASRQYDIFSSTRFLIRGNSITFTVIANEVANGTFLFWNNIGSSNGDDFAGGQNSGRFVINNNSGSFTIQLLDIISIGSENIVIEIRTGSFTGTVVATSDTTTIYNRGLLIQASDYNNIFGTINTLMGKNPLGYGAALKSTSSSAGKLITTSTWLDSITDLQKCSIHQVGSINSSLDTIRNSIFDHNPVKAIDVGGINEVAQVLYTNSGTVHASQLTSITTNPKPSASTWTISTTTNVGFTWRDIADVNYFFNLGSVIKPQISITGADSASWQPLVDQANLTTFGKSEFYAGNLYIRNYSSGGRNLNISYNINGPTLVASAAFSAATARITTIVQFAATYSVDTVGGIAAPVPSGQVIAGSLAVSPSPIPVITTKANQPISLNLTFTNNTDQPCTISSINNINSDLTFSHAAVPVTIAARGSVVLSVTYQASVSALYQDQILVLTSVGQIVLPTVVKVNLDVQVSPDSSWILPNVTVDDFLQKQFTFRVVGGGHRISNCSKSGNNPDQFTITQNSFLNVNAYFDPKTQLNGLHTMNIVFTVIPNNPEIDTINIVIPVSITTNIVNQHLGSWLSPQSRANSVIGLSYDIIGGRRTLTVGFGTDQARNQQSYGLYSAIKMLGIPGNIRIPIYGYPYQNPEYGTFLNTYGVWYAPNGAGTGSWNVTGTPLTFFVSTAGTHNYEFSVDNSGTVYIDGNAVVTYSGFSTSQSGSIYLAAGVHTVSWNVNNSGGPGAIGFRLYNAANNTDVWSTLSIAPRWGDWYDVFRIPLTGQPATVYSSPNYQIQGTLWYNGNTISSYFGSGSGAGTIITVNDDGLGNLGILLNPVGSKPGDEGEFDITVGDTTYAFNYADGISNRYFNLEDPIGSQTRAFTGFDRGGNVQTALVTYNPTPAAGGGGSDFPWWLPILLLPLGKVICTKLHELGYLPKDIFEADQEFGKWLVENDPDVYYGYRAWADIVVKWMEGSGPDMMLWIRDPAKRKQAQIDWSTSWAREIATPWAEEIAYRAGRTEKGNVTGNILMLVGGPISKFIGIWNRKFPSKSNKPAGKLTGLALIGIFMVLKTIVKVSNIFTKGK